MHLLAIYQETLRQRQVSEQPQLAQRFEQAMGVGCSYIGRDFCYRWGWWRLADDGGAVFSTYTADVGGCDLEPDYILDKDSIKH